MIAERNSMPNISTALYEENLWWDWFINMIGRTVWKSLAQNLLGKSIFWSMF